MKAQTKARIVYQTLKHRVLTGQLSPDARLVIRRLAEEFAVSDIPVREALKMLERDGLITLVPYSGATVVDLSPDKVIEFMLIRSRLEGLATRLALEGLTPHAMRELWHMVAIMDSHIVNGQYEEYGTLNREFHTYLYSLAPYPRLRQLIEDTWDLSRWMRNVFAIAPGRAAQSNAEHRAILNALTAGDAEGAEVLARDHKWATTEALLRHFAERRHAKHEAGRVVLVPHRAGKR